MISTRHGKRYVLLNPFGREQLSVLQWILDLCNVLVCFSIYEKPQHGTKTTEKNFNIKLQVLDPVLKAKKSYKGKSEI